MSQPVRRDTCPELGHENIGEQVCDDCVSPAGLDLMSSVVAALRDCTMHEAHLEYPGWVGVTHRNGSYFAFGNGNACWSGERYERPDSGRPVDSYDSTINSKSADVSAIVEWIVSCLARGA